MSELKAHRFITTDVPHSVENIHRICDTCMMPIEVKNPWNEKENE